MSWCQILVEVQLMPGLFVVSFKSQWWFINCLCFGSFHTHLKIAFYISFLISLSLQLRVEVTSCSNIKILYSYFTFVFFFFFGCLHCVSAQTQFLKREFQKVDEEVLVTKIWSQPAHFVKQSALKYKFRLFITPATPIQPHMHVTL